MQLVLTVVHAPCTHQRLKRLVLSPDDDFQNAGETLHLKSFWTPGHLRESLESTNCFKRCLQSSHLSVLRCWLKPRLLYGKEYHTMLMEKLRQHGYTAHANERRHCTCLFSMGWIVWCESCQTSMNRNDQFFLPESQDTTLDGVAEKGPVQLKLRKHGLCVAERVLLLLGCWVSGCCSGFCFG